MSSESASSNVLTEQTSIEVPSLIDSVTIRRDERGIPYIVAANEEDLFFAQGYATASDRLWQMDFLRRTARGELAEILGPAALELDKLHRIYGFRNVAEKLLERASAETRTVLEAYARGVNFFISQCDSLPPEFNVLRYRPREWTTIDSLALGKLFAKELSFSADVDLLRVLLSDLPRETFDALFLVSSPLDVIPDGQAQLSPTPARTDARPQSPGPATKILGELLKTMRRGRASSGTDKEVGSNSWVISGALSASGKPMLASDPHLSPSSPSIWHITHLSTKEFRVCGVAAPGIPGIAIGHNEHIAWGMTNLAPDVLDLYIEQFDASDPGAYRTPEGLRKAEVRTEEIVVRNPSATSGTESVYLDVKSTRHGPIIFENGALALALRWTALDDDLVDLDTFLGLNRAQNWNDFVAALRRYGGPPQNFTYADTAGHIGFYSAGRIPVRQTGDGSFPYDGTTDDGEWIGYVPFEELPHTFDPPSGFIVMANQRLAPDNYPHHLTHNWRVPYRAQRIKTLIEEQLKAKQKLSLDDFLSIQGDTYSYPDVLFASQIVELAKPLSAVSEDWRQLTEIFNEWDGYSNSQSTVMPLVTEMRKAFRRHILANVLGAERASLYEWRNESTFIDRLITERPLDWLPESFESYESLILACYREAVSTLENLLGSDVKQWHWGRLGEVRFPHPLEKLGPSLAIPAIAQNTGGSMPTVNAGSRVSMRFVVDLGDWDATRLCLPLGQSGDPSSPHRKDQFAEWSNVSPRILSFSEAAIDANAASESIRMKKVSQKF
ncbi:MAG TPA: penicillin acylase family protein [Pyrinomonadaceae bacterium]|nr:penicillin acylase family protein [Pyrinomonadaceae bacterium]